MFVLYKILKTDLVNILKLYVFSIFVKEYTNFSNLYPYIFYFFFFELTKVFNLLKIYKFQFFILIFLIKKSFLVII